MTLMILNFFDKRLKSSRLKPLHSAGALHDFHDPDFVNKRLKFLAKNHYILLELYMALLILILSIKG